MTTTTIQHRPAVTPGVGAVGRIFQMRCTCGEIGREWSTRAIATRDLAQHLLTLPRVPAAQRCRAQRAHDRRDWEPCGVCADQLPLFDL
jgi:hypothetical protein